MLTVGLILGVLGAVALGVALVLAAMLRSQRSRLAALEDEVRHLGGSMAQLREDLDSLPARPSEADARPKPPSVRT